MSVLNMYQIDLVNTVGESAAMGASGVIIWEKSLAVKTQVIIQSFVHLSSNVQKFEVINNF